MRTQVENRPTAAYILSLIGGILSLILGFVFYALEAFVFNLTGISLTVSGVLGLWIMVCSIVVIVAAAKLDSEPLEHTKWGVLILVFSIIGAWSLIDLIGGILALVYSPPIVGATPTQLSSASQRYPQLITRICPQCGRVIDESVKFCPYCGKQLG